MHLQCDTSHPQLKRSASGESHGSQTSTASSNKTLLFGEIPSPTSPLSEELRSYRSASSICNLVMSTSPSFQRFWMNENIRDNFLAQVPQEDLQNLRLCCHDFGARAAPFLFEDITVNFNSRSFTKPARIRALDKIGHHVKSLTFHMPHSTQTFLPPLIGNMTGEEEPFVYEPQVQHNPKEPRYGTWETTELLVSQYPPLFHAATNIPSFIRAFSAIPNLRHLKVSCPGQEPFYRYRRDTVDYALISLRIAIERAPLTHLSALSFLPIHPAGLLYLQPSLSYGSSPSAARRWTQISNMTIHMDTISFTGASQTDHLRILHAYLRFFSPHLHRLAFRWRDSKGPSPFSLDREPCMQHLDRANAYFNPLEPSTPTPTKPAQLKPLKFPRLANMELENAIMDSSQISAFITRHRHALAEFNFEDVHLRTGTWDEALAPLTRMAGNDDWRRKAECESMEVPLMLDSPAKSVRSGRQVRKEPEPIIMEMLGEEEEALVPRPLFGKWLSRGKSGRKQWSGGEHVRKLLRASLSPWR